MAFDVRNIKGLTDLITYFSEVLNWDVDINDFDNIENITYNFSAEDIGLQEDSFAKISSLRQLPPLIDEQPYGIFCVEFDSKRFEVTALRKILSGLVSNRRNSIDHATWDQHDLLFLCFWGYDDDRTIGIAHFQEKESGLPQIRMISCAPAKEDFTQIRVFEERLSKLRWPDNTKDSESWRQSWSTAFTTGYQQTIRDASTLTIQLASEAQHIRDQILEILNVESANGYVHLLYEKFKNTLIHDMTDTQFADMYAQTVVYGLFSARCMDSSQAEFNANDAVNSIPTTNPFLRNLMRECLVSEDNGNLSFDELEIGNVIDLLRHANTGSIIQDFNRQTGGGREDPVIHFYEEFLTAYDKTQKVQRGVYYTPQPVVDFIVRSVDTILKNDFHIPDGLASVDTKKIKIERESRRKRGAIVADTKEVPAIQILDPATGTGTFIRQIILQIYENFKEKHKGESKNSIQLEWNKYVPEYLLPRLNAFELMMAPYAVTHMKLAMVLKDTGYDFSGENRLQVFLTNSLEEPGTDTYQMNLFNDPLALESVEANKAKKNNGVNIIIGNPPYSGESMNKGAWILSLIEPYKTEPGGQVRLNERNSKWLNDDYVKFIRLGQLFIERCGNGILAFICPHGFIDNPTFRGMRWNLGAFFNKIYVLDLHGNAKKHEISPDGAKDENVFDIQQGVCILMMVKNGNSRTRLADVYHADLYGTREKKYNYLEETPIQQIKWDYVSLKEPFYLFKQTEVSENKKNKYFDSSVLFKKTVMGFQTHRDNFAIAFSREELENRISDMREDVLTDNEIMLKYSISNKDDYISKARKRLRSLDEGDINDKIALCQYRLFDVRWGFFDESFMDRPRINVFTNAINKDNFIFGIGRQGLAVGNIEWCLATISYYPLDANIFRRGGVMAAPLYLYEDSFEDTRVPNLNMNIVRNFEKYTGLKYVSEWESNEEKFSPLDVIDYVYAILYSHNYRKGHADELKINYPQVPYPYDAQYFRGIANYGSELRKLHTMEQAVDISSYSFSGTRDAEVDQYSYKDGKIYINKNMYFHGTASLIDEILWNYTIGGFQPLQKWLKDRKGLVLSPDDITTYKKIIASIRLTIELMDKIDMLYH